TPAPSIVGCAGRVSRTGLIDMGCLLSSAKIGTRAARRQGAVCSQAKGGCAILTIPLAKPGQAG
ncbi:MAG TPA: hypothetical protein VKN37_10725, partial [Roseovarius sp.]|nr:hypothetical protein [Roseovarius sp.]